MPSVIITDLKMEIESGIEFVDWIRRQPAPLRDTTVIILTGGASPLQWDAAQKVGAQKVIRKPADLRDLQTVLGNIAEEFCSERPPER